MNKLKKGPSTVNPTQVQAKLPDKDHGPSFHSLLASKLAGHKIDKISKRIDQIQDKVVQSILVKKTPNTYFIEQLSKPQIHLPVVQLLGEQLTQIEMSVARIINAETPKINLDSAIAKLQQTLKEVAGKPVMEILLSPASRRKLEKIKEQTKLKQSKSLLRKLNKDFNAFHNNYEDWMQQSLNKRDEKITESSKKKQQAQEEMRKTIKEHSVKKFERSKSRKQTEKELTNKNKIQLTKFLQEKPLYRQLLEDYEMRNQQMRESAIQQKREWLVNNAYSKDKQREHELKIMQMLKRRTILHNSLKNLKSIQPPTDPELEQKKQKLEKIKTFARVVKENHFPEVDPRMIEATQQKIQELEKKDKVKTEVIKNMEKNKDIGREYLREAGHIANRSLDKSRHTLRTEAQTRMSAFEVKSQKPKVEIPHVKTKFDDATIEDIIQSIESREINESNYAQILSKFDHAIYPHVIKKLAGALKMSQGPNVQMDFLLGSMRAKLKILDSLS
jgi:hypothetical protein